MINAWSLLYDEVLKMQTDHYFSNHYFNNKWKGDYDSFENPMGEQNLINIDIGMYDPSETMKLSDNDSYYGMNNPNLPPQMKDLKNENGFWKYEEDKTLNEVKNYLSGTYNAHYTSQESKTQTLDLIESIGDAEAFCRSNAIKYLSRFGKKNGKSKQDILQAIHYCILLYHFSGLHKQTSSYPQ